MVDRCFQNSNVTVKRYDRMEKRLKELWLKLEREGILEEKLLKHMWGSLAKEHHTSSQSWRSSACCALGLHLMSHLVRNIWCRQC